MAAGPHQQIISHILEEEEDGRNARIHRVPNYMRDKWSKDFKPLELFVGFYTHTALEDDPMHLDISKLAVAREFCRRPEPKAPPVCNPKVKRPIQPQVWKEFVSSLEAELKLARMKYGRLKYDTTLAEGENGVVALDALFIVAYLRFSYSWNDTWGYDFAAEFERSRFNAQRFPLLRDLLILENQVPVSLLLAVMKHLCKPSMESPSSELYDLLEWFVMAVYPFDQAANLDGRSVDLRRHLERLHKNGCDTFVNCDHLLHCAYLAICGPHSPSETLPVETSELWGQFLPCFKPAGINICLSLPAPNRLRIPSATSLRRLGISVEVEDNVLSLNNIRFERRKQKNVLLLPRLIMNDYTASVFRNLALYEQIKDNGLCPRGDMRTYLYLMSSLLDSLQDVHLLINRGVIVNQLGSAEAVHEQWNQMCDGLYISSSPPAYWSHIQGRISELETPERYRRFPEIESQYISSFLVFVLFVVGVMVLIASLLRTFGHHLGHPHAAIQSHTFTIPSATFLPL